MCACMCMYALVGSGSVMCVGTLKLSLKSIDSSHESAMCASVHMHVHVYVREETNLFIFCLALSNGLTRSIFGVLNAVRMRNGTVTKKSMRVSISKCLSRVNIYYCRCVCAKFNFPFLPISISCFLFTPSIHAIYEAKIIASLK